MSLQAMSRVWDDRETTSSHQLVMLALADRADEDGICWADLQWIAQRANVSDRQARALLRDLEASGRLLTIDRKGGHGHTNLYVVTAGLTAAEIEEHSQKVSNCEYPKQFSEKRIVNRRKEGYVYLLHHDGLYKIGRTAKLSKRVAEISPKMPHEVTLIHSIKTDDTEGLEALLHKRYTGKRMNGEWFALDNEDVRDITAESGL